MAESWHRKYIAILQKELISAFGCTEPIAIAYAAACARELLGRLPDSIEISLSGNVLKNVKGVTVPCSGGRKGATIAAALGVFAGDAKRGLQVLSMVTAQQAQAAVAWLGKVRCQIDLASENGLYIAVRLVSSAHTAEVVLAGAHNRVIRRVKDEILLPTVAEPIVAEPSEDMTRVPLSIAKILEFADCVTIQEIADILQQQVKQNDAIACEGLLHPYGAEVGRTLLSVCGKDVKTRAKARAAAGSDARMSGCALPVVINSGSGNQGMTVSLPVLEYAREWKKTEEQLYRALAVSNLVAIHIKRYIGNLSAYCGAVSAACGAGAGIAYLYGGNYQQVADTITNTLANVSGMVCDGAKPSCAAKIASAVDAAILGYALACRQKVFAPGEGLVQQDVEQTIANIGRLGREGMRDTDREILQMMLE